jgi:hypothetical protein
VSKKKESTRRNVLHPVRDMCVGEEEKKLSNL